MDLKYLIKTIQSVAKNYRSNSGKKVISSLLKTCVVGSFLSIGLNTANAAEKKMVFIQFQPHTVSLAWSKGIEEVLSVQDDIDYQLLDGQGKVDVQINLMNTVINQGVDTIFIQPVDSVAISPAIKKAKRKGIVVITLNINATAKHAAHIEMNHYFGARQIAKVMGEKMGGVGKVAILNAPPGIIIRDQRTNGFIDGMKEYHPNIKIIANQVADWSRKKAQDVFSTMLIANPGISGVYGINDSMALGAVDVAKAKGLLDQIVIFGNDGERDALESIERGELSGTQYTDVYQQGRYAASIASVLATGNVDADDIKEQGHLLMPYIIATKETVADIKIEQRW
ncbi:sugar ABC transporter substrate-binding protein [Psychromonas sp. SA13A]|uniref:sugar ABC transporter substrate-binding protein n=1 Tax=Psychromonas sp. SA13A TaxID=2686346 RepID=UPI001408FEE6|nr:sugar ABC transporter substrate-binding protein [Psychromonas sp. SA13A]